MPFAAIKHRLRWSLHNLLPPPLRATAPCARQLRARARKPGTLLAILPRRTKARFEKYREIIASAGSRPTHLQTEISLNSKKLSPIWIILLIGSSALTSYGAKKSAPTQTLQIQPFTAGQDVKVTDKYMQEMMKNIVKQLTNTKRFRIVVLGTAGSPAQSTQPGILLTGELSTYNPGSRAARFGAGSSGWIYLATKGGRAGEAKVTAHVQFIDSETGTLLHEEDVEGVVRGNPLDMNPKHTFGASANETTQKIAKQIASAAKSDLR